MSYLYVSEQGASIGIEANRFPWTDADGNTHTETYRPRISCMDPRRIDLPAPVSPVRMFSPGPNSTSMSSIRARFFT